MPKSEIIGHFGLIGDNLEFKKDVKIKINEKGDIQNITYNEIDDEIHLSKQNYNSLIIPGLINSHVHIGDSFAKEQGFNQNLKEIVSPPGGLKHLLLDSTPKNIIVKAIKRAILEMLSNGITNFIDFREGGVKGIRLIREVINNMRIINYLSLGRYLDKDDIEEVFNLADGIGLPSYRFINLEIKEELKKCKQKFRKVVACHIAELNRDENLIQEAINDKIVEIFIHGTHFIDKDLKNIRREKKSLVICPRSNGYFGVGFPPIDRILKLNIPISLGTDNIMANSPDLFEELRYLYRILRIQDNNLEITGKELLKMVTINAAKIYDIFDHTGSIAEGKKADLFVINLDDPNYYVPKIDIKNIYALIIGRTNSFNIKKTYVKGQLVHEKK